tara:strand:+ start:65 stop:364 length:300 start_codon:yes stop_codon:yes gene_type:complete
MKITKRQLKKIIKEERARLLKEFGSEEFGRQTKEFEPIAQVDPGAAMFSGDVQDVAAAQEKIEVVLNALYDSGVENEGLKALLNNIIRDIDSGFIGEPT